MMFERFGEFDSAEELNRAAAAQLAEGDLEAVFALAEENGIDREDAEDYVDGVIKELVTPLTAALGKLKIESEELKLGGVLVEWVDELRDMCLTKEEFVYAVRRKGKVLAKYLALTADYGYENRTVVDKKIVERTQKIKNMVGSHGFAIGIPDKKTRRELALKYYMGQERGR